MRRPQPMWIMGLVWPLTASFGSIIWLAAYWRWGRTDPAGQKPKIGQAAQVFKGASHCGAGCTLGDIFGEGLAILFPGLLTLFGHKLTLASSIAISARWLPIWQLSKFSSEESIS